MKNLLIRLKKTERLPLFTLLFLSCLFCFAISLYRVFVTDTGLFFIFMNKNLFLAFIPFAISTYFILFPAIKKRKYVFPLLCFLWLAFFPNAPYMITDLFHLKPRTNGILWLDLGILYSFAWTGLILGLVSLMDMQHIFSKKFSQLKMTLLTILLLFGTGFGVYLGRFLRWNSWDFVHQPMGLVSDILQRLVFPFDHPRTWGMTLLYGTLFNLIYWTVKLLRNEQKIVQ